MREQKAEPGSEPVLDCEYQKTTKDTISYVYGYDKVFTGKFQIRAIDVLFISCLF